MLFEDERNPVASGASVASPVASVASVASPVATGDATGADALRR